MASAASRRRTGRFEVLRCRRAGRDRPTAVAVAGRPLAVACPSHGASPRSWWGAVAVAPPPTGQWKLFVKAPTHTAYLPAAGWPTRKAAVAAVVTPPPCRDRSCSRRRLC